MSKVAAPLGATCDPPGAARAAQKWTLHVYMYTHDSLQRIVLPVRVLGGRVSVYLFLAAVNLDPAS